MPPAAPFDLVLPGGTRVPLTEMVTLGRDPDSTVVLVDPAVSRVHARIEGLTLEDAGSSNGTFLDGRRVLGRASLHDGSRLRIGDSELAVERRRGAAEAGRTIVVPTAAEPAGDAGPRVRPGYALKRLDATEGDRRWILKDLEDGRYLRLNDRDAQLFQLIDGTRTTAQLVAEAERLGDGGAGHLANLLAGLGDRGFLEGIEGSSAPPQRKWLQPREKVFPGAGDAFAAAYQAGGRLLFTSTAIGALAVVAASGLIAFVYLVAGRYGTPFVVASKLGIGGLVFLVGRFAVVAIHELAHGLAMTHAGRRVERAGVKMVLIFPYAFVDTSAAWFEPRRSRITISAAGPISDAVLGGAFSLACLVSGPGAVRDVCFQVAFGAYLGACFNLNPFLDRDGYHILVDLLREPNLRKRARTRGPRTPLLRRYARLGLAWSCVAVAFVVAMTLRVRPTLNAILPDWLVWVGIVPVWLVALVPVFIAARRA